MVGVIISDIICLMLLIGPGQHLVLLCMLLHIVINKKTGQTWKIVNNHF